MNVWRSGSLTDGTAVVATTGKLAAGCVLVQFASEMLLITIEVEFKMSVLKVWLALVILLMNLSPVPSL